MAKFSRDKGKRGERATATELRDAFPRYAERIRRGWQVREGCDDADVVGIPGLWFEVKCGKKPNPRAALSQAIRERDRMELRLDHTRRSRYCAGCVIPIAVIRDDRQEPFAVLPWSDLIELLKEVVDGRDREGGAGVQPGDEGPEGREQALRAREGGAREG